MNRTLMGVIITAVLALPGAIPADVAPTAPVVAAGTEFPVPEGLTDDGAGEHSITRA